MFSKLFSKKRRIPEENLPQHLTAMAYQARNKELAWKKKDILFVLEELRKLGIAVEHGEVWLIEGNGRWTGLIPYKNAKAKVPGSIYHWEVEFKKNEKWEEYLDRSVIESMDAVANLNPEDEVIENIKDRIYYNLLLLPRENFKRIV